MADTKIEWAEKSWNPIAGCTKCSPGCLNCYAERMAKRLYWMGMARPSTLPEYMNFEKGWLNGHIDFLEHRLKQPLHWRKPSRIFVCSMSDLFHEKVPFEFIDKVHAAMIMAIRRGRYHTYLILTKRIKRMLKYYSSNRRPQLFDILEKDYDEFIGFFGINWPFPVLHLSVSISNQPEADEKIPILLQIHAAVRGLIIEPMLGSINIDKWIWGNKCPDPQCGDSTWDHYCQLGEQLLHWVVVGGESGPGARPMHPDWVRNIRDQCIAAGVPFYFKQWGEWLPVSQMTKEQKEVNKLSWWPNRVTDIRGERFLRFTKKKAGCILDGKEWKQLPAPVANERNIYVMPDLQKGF